MMISLMHFCSSISRPPFAEGSSGESLLSRTDAMRFAVVFATSLSIFGVIEPGCFIELRI
jgi:hypothetical protein